jgi:uncharacterized protein YndB with AHSA1/START domain
MFGVRHGKGFNMAIDLIHHITVAAPADRIYRAITTEEGIRGWWTTDVVMGARVGDKAVFGFHKHSVTFEMRIVELTPSSVVRWRCEESNCPEWIGTTQEFRLEPQADGEVLVKFCHGGWQSDKGHCYPSNTTWGHLMVLLKNYVERGETNLYFT